MHEDETPDPESILFRRGHITGFLIALILGVIAWHRLIYPSMAAEVQVFQVALAIQYLDDLPQGGPNRQFMLDDVANSYAAARRGLPGSTDLLQEIEAAAHRHPDLAKEIEKRKPF